MLSFNLLSDFYLNRSVDFITINFFIFLFYLMYVIDYFEMHKYQLFNTNFLVKFFILYESEHNTLPLDDIWGFILLFLLSITFFTLNFFFLFFYNVTFLNLCILSSFFIVLFMLLIPLNIFTCFGISAFSVINGCSNTSFYLKEILFDCLACFIIFTRFIVQNIRLILITSLLVEYIEYISLCNNNAIINYIIYNNNFFINFNINNFDFSISNFCFFFINSIWFLLINCYYFLHLLVIFFVQLIVYICVCLWLFFFLYSSKFFQKHEQFIFYKKQ